MARKHYTRFRSRGMAERYATGSPEEMVISIGSLWVLVRYDYDVRAGEVIRLRAAEFRKDFPLEWWPLTAEDHESAVCQIMEENGDGDCVDNYLYGSQR